jgi:hypothetical protein
MDIYSGEGYSGSGNGGASVIRKKKSNKLLNLA